MRNARLDESQAGIKIAGRSINNLRYADDTTLMAKSEEEPKSPLMRVKEEHEKAALKLNIQQTKIMASSSTTSWQIEEEKWKQRQIPAPLRAPKSLQTVIAAMKLKDTWKESYNKLRQQRHYFADKGPYSQGYGFSSSHVWI